MQRHDRNDRLDFYSLDQAQRDAAYNNSLAVIDSAARLKDWEERSAVLRALPETRTDIRYGEEANNRFDYFSSGKVGAPLFVFIHGGYWHRNNKEIFGFVAAGPNARGIDVATIGYTLAPQASLTTIVEEVFKALKTLRDQAERFGFDRDAIFVGGWSAGGHLATLAANLPFIRGVLSISGIYDLEPIAVTYINDELALQPNELTALSPVRSLPRQGVPVSVFVGGEELSELQRQAREFKKCAESNDVDVTMTTLAGCNHYTIMEELAAPQGALTEALVRLIANATSDT